MDADTILRVSAVGGRRAGSETRCFLSREIDSSLNFNNEGSASTVRFAECSDQTAYCVCAVFGNHGADSGAFCKRSEFGRGVVREENHPCRGSDGSHLRGRFDAVQPRHGQVQDDKIGFRRFNERDGGFTVLCLATYFPVRISFNTNAQSLPDYAAVIDDRDPHCNAPKIRPKQEARGQRLIVSRVTKYTTVTNRQTSVGSPRSYPKSERVPLRGPSG